MSQRSSIGVLPADTMKEVDAALANPPDPFQSWAPVHEERMSELCTAKWPCEGTADGGETSFVINANPQVLGTGAAVVIRYERNVLAECAENTALDDCDDNPLDEDIIDQILHRVQPNPGLRTIIKFQTLPDGSFDVENMSSLRATHRLRQAPHVLLVKPLSEPAVRVLKLCNGGSRVAEEIEFMSRLPEVDFLLRPTHLVLDEAGLCHGFLLDYHPASSLRITMDLLHPDAKPPVLPPSSVDQSSCWLAGIPTSVPWPVKLVWATDIAAAVAWLHARAIVWADLKTDNILLCTDGHCRLIDYCPGGWTPPWTPPEAQSPGWEGTTAGDVFALGLVFWCVAVEVGGGKREQEYVSPLLWTEGIPSWFQSLASSCIEHDPGRRPSAHRVYKQLLSPLEEISTVTVKMAAMR
ncbi:kinase-like domain-containing protein [Mycena pura]|uniref:Kinase-like domain-containing protein n=1 Tax=Mycena pura TaxID=153505 RepID=A0AAD7E340_9AGAR|nr:kinase-like domain-containing protein [Mycena pura]